MDGTGSSPLLGTPTARDWKGEGFEGRPLAEVLALTLLPTPTAADGTKVARNKTSGRKPDSKHHTGTTMQDVAYEWAVKLLPTPLANPTERTPERHAEKRRGDASGPASSSDVAVEWGEYEPAIRRWEAIHGPAPAPLTRVRGMDDGDAKMQRVRARMDRQRLSALGDGVHVYVGRLLGDAIMTLAREDGHA
jgi:hypothetical protein